jgi:hypothetical protein
MLIDDLEIAFHRGLDTRHESLLLRRDRSIRQSSDGRFWRKAVIGQRGDVREMPIRKGPPECGRAGHHLAQCEAVSRYLIGGQWKLVADTLRWRAHVQLPPAASGGHQPRQTHRMVKGYFPRAWWTAFKLAQARDKFRVRIVDRP